MLTWINVIVCAGIFGLIFSKMDQEQPHPLEVVIRLALMASCISIITMILYGQTGEQSLAEVTINIAVLLCLFKTKGSVKGIYSRED